MEVATLVATFPAMVRIVVRITRGIIGTGVTSRGAYTRSVFAGFSGTAFCITVSAVIGVGVEIDALITAAIPVITFDDAHAAFAHLSRGALAAAHPAIRRGRRGIDALAPACRQTSTAHDTTGSAAARGGTTARDGTRFAALATVCRVCVQVNAGVAARDLR